MLVTTALPLVTESADPVGRAAASVEVTGNATHGVFTLSSQDLGWVHVAYEPTPDAELSVEYTIEFDHQGEPKDREQRWRGFAIGSWDPDRLTTRTFDLTLARQDGRQEVYAHYRDTTVHEGIPDPWRTSDRLLNRNRLVNEDYQWTPLSDGVDGVEPFLFVAGGEPLADPLEFEFRWENTTVNFTWGPQGDLMRYYLEDFDSTLQVRADTPLGGYESPGYSTEATLVTEVVAERPRTFFWYFPRVGDDSERWYDRPDGSRGPAFGVPDAEDTALPGPWVFHVGDGFSDRAEHAPLFGVRYQPAELAVADAGAS